MLNMKNIVPLLQMPHSSYEHSYILLEMEPLASGLSLRDHAGFRRTWLANTGNKNGIIWQKKNHNNRGELKKINE